MATGADLLAIAVSPNEAELLGTNIYTVNCTGTSSGAAAAINPDAGLVLLNGTTSNTGAAFAATVAQAKPIYVIGVGLQPPVIYLPSGQTINAGAASLTFSAANARCTLLRVSATQWYSLPLAP